MKTQTRKRLRTFASHAMVLLGLFAGALPAAGAPVISGITGAFDHKGTVTVSGSGFGSKTSAAPVAWDDATGNGILGTWDGAWPNQLPGYNTGYYSPMRGINPPHAHDSRYIAGAHASNAGANSGYDVVVYKNIQAQPYPFYVYASWYQRADDAWIFGEQADNYKAFIYSSCCTPYTAPYWSLSYGPPHPTDAKDQGLQWIIVGETLSLPDASGHNAWWGIATNPMAGKWSKEELVIKVTDQADGFVHQSENGHQVVSYVGPTDKTFSGPQRTVGIGGYSNMQGHSSNWRYFDDVYMDTTLSRIVLADKPSLSAATIIENQIPSTWSDGSITATVNLGQFVQGQTAYLFVVDSSGTPNSSGMPVTVGGTANAPNAPTAVSVH